MPSMVQRSAFSEAIRSLFGVQGPFGLSVIDDVFPVFALPSGLEDLELLGIRRWAAGNLTGPNVGLIERHVITNPIGSGNLVVVERFSAGGAAQNVRCSVQAIIGLTNGSIVPLDSRRGVAGAPVSTTCGLTTNPGAGSPFVARGQTNTTWQDVGLVLAPGWSAVFDTEVANTAVGIVVQGYERRFMNSELP